MASPDAKLFYFDLQYGLALNIDANVGNCFYKTHTYIILLQLFYYIQKCHKKSILFHFYVVIKYSLKSMFLIFIGLKIIFSHQI